VTSQKYFFRCLDEHRDKGAVNSFERGYNTTQDASLNLPGHPVIKISFGGSFPSLSGGGELNVRRCFTAAEMGSCGLQCLLLTLFGTG
jgi:hypothetical protein